MTEELRRLVILPVSPWSERAKWALDHHGLRYQIIEHQPFIGEWRLRWLSGPGDGPRTVPLLLVGGERIRESWDIARYADREGSASPLIPPELEGDVRRWNELADRAMAAGRTRVCAALLASPEALDEALPPAVPRWLRPWLRPITAYGTRWFADKYAADLGATERAREELRGVLTRLRAALDHSPYLLGAFTYADVVMALILQGIAPAADRYLPVGPGTRRAWSDPELSAEFADLIRWRDQLYERHRKPRLERGAAEPAAATSAA